MGNFCFGVPDLAAIRARRGISLREIAATTKISAYYLEAIENGKFEKLPGGVYTRSYIRQYARAIDFDEAVILQALSPDTEQQQAPMPHWKRVLLVRILHFVRLPFAGLGAAAKRAG